MYSNVKCLAVKPSRPADLFNFGSFRMLHTSLAEIKFIVLGNMSSMCSDTKLLEPILCTLLSKSEK